MKTGVASGLIITSARAKISESIVRASQMIIRLELMGGCRVTNSSLTMLLLPFQHFFYGSSSNSSRRKRNVLAWAHYVTARIITRKERPIIEDKTQPHVTMFASEDQSSIHAFIVVIIIPNVVVVIAAAPAAACAMLFSNRLNECCEIILDDSSIVRSAVRRKHATCCSADSLASAHRRVWLLEL